MKSRYSTCCSSFEIRSLRISARQRLFQTWLLMVLSSVPARSLDNGNGPYICCSGVTVIRLPSGNLMYISNFNEIYRWLTYEKCWVFPSVTNYQRVRRWWDQTEQLDSWIAWKLSCSWTVFIADTCKYSMPWHACTWCWLMLTYSKQQQNHGKTSEHAARSARSAREPGNPQD